MKKLKEEKNENKSKKNRTLHKNVFDSRKTYFYNRIILFFS